MALPAPLVSTWDDVQLNLQQLALDHGVSLPDPDTLTADGARRNFDALASALGVELPARFTRFTDAQLNFEALA